jgi:RNA polymerase sigma factor (sigma-70 family)
LHSEGMSVLRGSDGRRQMHEGAKDKVGRFVEVVLPHLDAAYNLARWLTRDSQDAEDLVQMAFVRAFRFYGGFRGDNARAWLLTIVRHAFYTTLRDGRNAMQDVEFDEAVHSAEAGLAAAACFIGADPEATLSGRDTRAAVNAALEQLPQAFREVVVLKDIEELSYREIADVVGIPVGTVMSRLARGRRLLRSLLSETHAEGRDGHP